MNRFPMLGTLLIAGASSAAEPPRDAGYAPLEHLVGTWTIAGKEDGYRETCAWYHGNRHIVCETESKRADGSVSHGMSILSFVPGSGYVYTGIGSDGRYETYRNGTFDAGVLEYVDRSGAETVRIRVGPLGDKARIPFNVATSTDGVTWTPADSFTYVRVGNSLEKSR